MGNISTQLWHRFDYTMTTKTGSNPTITSVGSWFPVKTNWRTGSSNPKWREVVALGGNATHNLDAERFSIDTDAKGHFVLTDRDGAGNLVQEKTFSGVAKEPSFGNVSGEFTDANNLALRLAFKRIADNRTSFQGQIFLGELRESIKMLTSPAKALRTGLSDYLSTAVKRGKASPRKARRKVVAETWLEYSFGWVPLLSDIAEAQKAYAKHVNKTFTTRITSRGNSSTTFYGATNRMGDNANSVPLLWDNTRVNTQSVQYIVGLKYATAGAAPDVSIAERAGFTFAQFVPTLWELLPWSFLVDYFTNIGDIINAGATDTSSVSWVCKTTKSSSVMKDLYSPDTTKSVGGRVISGTPSYTATSHSYVTRRPGVLTIPNFTVSLPSHPTQWINMAALSQGVNRARASFL